MKKINIILAVVMLSLVSTLKANAQYGHGPDWLGEWYTIHISFTNDYVNDQWATYSFPHPPEFLGPASFTAGNNIGTVDDLLFYCIGPGLPYITTYNNEPVLHLNLASLKNEIEIDNLDWMNHPIYETTIEFPVKKQISSFGGGVYQCYYSLRLSISQ